MLAYSILKFTRFSHKFKPLYLNFKPTKAIMLPKKRIKNENNYALCDMLCHAGKLR